MGDFTIIITLSTSSNAFNENPKELHDIFLKLAKDLLDTTREIDYSGKYPIRDSNGNTIGAMQVDEN